MESNKDLIISVRLTPDQHSALTRYANKKRQCPSWVLQKYVDSIMNGKSTEAPAVLPKRKSKVFIEDIKLPVEHCKREPDGLPVPNITGMDSKDAIKFSLVAVYCLEDELSRYMSFELGALEKLKQWKPDYDKLCNPDGQDLSSIDRSIYSQYVQLEEEVVSNHRLNILPVMYMIRTYIAKMREIPIFREKFLAKTKIYGPQYKVDFDSAFNGVTEFFRKREDIVNSFRSTAMGKQEIMEILMSRRDVYYREMNIRNEACGNIG